MWYAQRSKEKKEADGSNADAKKRNRNQELKNVSSFNIDQKLLKIMYDAMIPVVF